MFFKKYGDIVVGVFFMILSSALIVMAKLLPKSKVMDIGPDFMPLCIGSVTLVLAAVLTFLSLRDFKTRSARLDAMDAGDLPDCDYRRVLESIMLVLIYVFILQPVGFIISTMLYLMLQMLVLSPDNERGKKDILKLAVINIIFTMIVFFLFRYGFKIVLPAGIFTINL